MKTNNRKKIMPIVIGACILWIFSGFFINKYYHKNVRSKPKMYAYQTYWGPVNPVLYVKDKHNIDSLIEYYQKIEKGNLNAEFNFPPLLLPYDTCVYVLGYEADSLVTKVLCYYNWGNKVVL